MGTIVNTKNLQSVRLKDAKLGEALDSHSNAIGNLSSQMGADPNGATTMSGQVGQLQINPAATGSGCHAVWIDTTAKYRAITYFLEVQQNGGNWVLVYDGPSRQAYLNLPNGSYAIRVYSQYTMGGPANSPVYGQGFVISKSFDHNLNALMPTGAGTATVSGQGAGAAVSSTVTTRNPSS